MRFIPVVKWIMITNYFYEFILFSYNTLISN